MEEVRRGRRGGGGGFRRRSIGKGDVGKDKRKRGGEEE